MDHMVELSEIHNTKVVNFIVVIFFYTHLNK